MQLVISKSLFCLWNSGRLRHGQWQYLLLFFVTYSLNVSLGIYTEVQSRCLRTACWCRAASDWPGKWPLWRQCCCALAVLLFFLCSSMARSCCWAVSRPVYWPVFWYLALCSWHVDAALRATANLLANGVCWLIHPEEAAQQHVKLLIIAS